MNDELRGAMRIRNDIGNQLNDRNNIVLQDRYRQEKRNVKSLIARTKAQHYNSIFNDNRGNTSKIWKTIREIVPSRNTNSNACIDNGGDEPNEFNKLFANVGKNTFQKTQEILHGAGVPHPAMVQEHFGGDDAFRPHPVDTETVILTIKSLNETSSVGSDGISLKFIKDALYVLPFYITCIVNTSIVTGIVPNTWKHALVLPLFKSGGASDFNKIRPISLLPIISKILEKIVANQLTHFLETKKLLSNCQHGFPPKLSTEIALTVITDKIYSNMDS